MISLVIYQFKSYTCFPQMSFYIGFSGSIFFFKDFLKIDVLLIVVKESLSTTKLQWPTEVDCLV